MDAVFLGRYAGGRPVAAYSAISSRKSCDAGRPFQGKEPEVTRSSTAHGASGQSFDLVERVSTAR
jgi:hypothetical protein